MVRTGGSFWYSFGMTDKKQVANMRVIRKARRYLITVNKVDADKCRNSGDENYTLVFYDIRAIS